MNLNYRNKYIMKITIIITAILILSPCLVIAASVVTKSFKVQQGEAHARFENVTIYERVFVSVPPADNALDAKVTVQLERIIYQAFGPSKTERIGGPWVVVKGSPIWINTIPKDGDFQLRIVNKDCWLEVGVYLAMEMPEKKK